MREHSTAELAAQPIGYWSGETYRVVVGRIRAELAEERLTQAHWWILNHVAATPGGWSRATLTERLRRFDDLDTDFAEVFDDLAARGWVADHGTLSLTEDGEAGRLRARQRNTRAHEQMHAGISDEEYAAALTVLRRIIDNLGGDSDLP